MNQLQHLNLSHANFTGIVPHNLGNLSRLRVLDLSRNSFTGELPFLGNMNWLEYLDLSQNEYNFLSDHNPHFVLPKNVAHGDLSSNNLYHNTNWISNLVSDKCSLKSLQLNANQLYGDISRVMTGCWINKLENLNLWGNYFNDTIPVFLGKLAALTELDISENNLSGLIPNSIGGAYFLQWLHLNNNSLTGQLPSTLKNCTLLRVLDVGDNNLHNDFYVPIPPAFCQFYRLQVMDVSNNKFTGYIPRCFGNFSGMTVINPSGFFNDSEWSSVALKQVIKGVQREYTTTSKYVVNLDLSNNYFVGEIPLELTRLFVFIGLNISRNHLGGNIPTKIGDLKLLESLDLSNNNLVEEIPQSLSILMFLSHLNMSNNNMSGPIPTGHQLQVLEDPSIYSGNPRLCGPPLMKFHTEEKPAPTPTPQEEEEEDEDEDERLEEIYFYAFVISGFATSFWGFVGLLLFKPTWKQALFRLVEVTLCKMLGY
ncbi:hypothetical protein ACP275_05G084300 [Erythranthe tilingii]